MLPVVGGLLVALLPLVPEGVAQGGARAPVILDARLRADVVDVALAGAHLRGGVFALPQPVPQPAAAQPAPAAAQPACPSEGDACQESEQIARNVLRHRERSLRTHRAFGIAAWGSMLVTEVLGTIQLVNQDTWFGRGACASDPSAFACRQSSLVTGLHEGFAFTTVGLYLTAGIIAASAADPENASEGEGRAQSRLRLHKTMAWIHGAGMVLLPILGILSAYPQILGATSDEARADVGRALRTIHGIVGYTTFAALTFSGVLEL